MQLNHNGNSDLKIHALNLEADAFHYKNFVEGTFYEPQTLHEKTDQETKCA